MHFVCNAAEERQSSVCIPIKFAVLHASSAMRSPEEARSIVAYWMGGRRIPLRLVDIPATFLRILSQVLNLCAGFYKFVVHNVKELELLLMHNRCALFPLFYHATEDSQHLTTKYEYKRFRNTHWP